MTEPRLRNFLPLILAVVLAAAFVSPAREVRRGGRAPDPLAPATPTPTAVPPTPTPTSTPTPTPTATPGCAGRGDVDNSGHVDVSDVFFLINYLFAGGAPPTQLCRADVNNDGNVDVTDVFYLINFLFAGGSAPPP